MTNNELLHASLLDIIFDNRNKEYGAYTLRKGYNHRLLISLGAGLSLVILFVLICWLNNNDNSLRKNPSKSEGVIVTVIELPKEKIKKPEPVVKKIIPEPVHPATAEPVAAVQFPPIKIVPDELADPDPVASQADMINKQIATINADGKVYINGVNTDKSYVPGGNENEDLPASEQTLLPNSNPEFRGGQEALIKFLSRNLIIPDELENDEKRMVKARFKVNPDGLVLLVEIVQTAGDLFDKEVIRVCKKMPRWRPAMQNGVAVSMSYLLPVTFIRADQ